VGLWINTAGVALHYECYFFRGRIGFDASHAEYG
jgi:hypothetical protein